MMNDFKDVEVVGDDLEEQYKVFEEEESNFLPKPKVHNGSPLTMNLGPILRDALEGRR